jgi:hypothetical protein
MDFMHITSKYEQYKKFDQFIFANFCNSDKHEKFSLQKTYIEDISKLSNIMGRLEIYLYDKKDIENAHYMVLWFEKEFEENYSMDAFKEWLNDNK